MKVFQWFSKYNRDSSGLKKVHQSSLHEQNGSNPILVNNPNVEALLYLILIYLYYIEAYNHET